MNYLKYINKKLFRKLTNLLNKSFIVKKNSMYIDLSNSTELNYDFHNLFIKYQLYIGNIIQNQS